jgi:hypothetical protein
MVVGSSVMIWSSVGSGLGADVEVGAAPPQDVIITPRMSIAPIKIRMFLYFFIVAFSFRCYRIISIVLPLSSSIEMVENQIQIFTFLAYEI